jgi:hypothetical protein
MLTSIITSLLAQQLIIVLSHSTLCRNLYSSMALARLQESDYFVLRATFKFLRITLAVIILAGSPIFLPLTAIFFLSVRKIVSVFASIAHRKGGLGNIVTCAGSIFAVDEFYDNPKLNIVALVTVEGNFDKIRFREIFMENVILAKGSRVKEQLEYPELTQSIVNWGGYFFWKDCPNFDYNKQVRVYNNGRSQTSSYTDIDLHSIRQTLLNQPWEKNMPLWEVILIQNCYPSNRADSGPHTTIVFRFHHVLADGYAPGAGSRVQSAPKI